MSLGWQRGKATRSCVPRSHRNAALTPPHVACVFVVGIHGIHVGERQIHSSRSGLHLDDAISQKLQALEGAAFVFSVFIARDALLYKAAANTLPQE